MHVEINDYLMHFASMYCQCKVEMSLFLQSRDVPLAKG